MGDYESFGTLRIFLKHAYGGAPAPGATAQVWMGGVAAATAFTGPGGKAEITLPSGVYGSSRMPEPSSPAFMVYDVKISLRGHVPLIFKGVRIFPGETTVIKRDMERTVDCPKKRADVCGVMPRECVPERKCGGRLLDFHAEKAPPFCPGQMKLPRCLKVRAGKDGENAADIPTPFLEYLKAAASCLLFPGWGEETQTAGVIALTSLILNRVYAAAHRARGGGCDISAGTPEDLPFVRGVPTFESINRVCEKNLGTYIYKPHENAPFPAGFCGGRLNEQEGLSLWGAVELEKQGYTAKEILRYYYGEDIALKKAKPASPENDFFPGTLKVGAKGADVAFIKQRLNRVAGEFPAVSFAGGDPGDYDGAMALAVKSLRRAFGARPAGTVDRDTWNLILYLYAHVKCPASSQSAKESGEGMFPGYTLCAGEEGADIIKARFFLERLSARLGESKLPSPGQGSVFDGVLEETVRAFQDYSGFNPTGTIDEGTWNAIYAAFYDIQAEEFPKTNPYPGSPVRYGDSGPAVEYIQKALNTVGKRVMSVPKLTEDGAYGDLTRNAVKAFQKYFGLSADGVAGPLTWARLSRELPGANGFAGEAFSERL